MRIIAICAVLMVCMEVIGMCLRVYEIVSFARRNKKEDEHKDIFQMSVDVINKHTFEIADIWRRIELIEGKDKMEELNDTNHT